MSSKAKQPAKPKGDLALPMRVNELLLDLHIGAVAHDPLDHRRHFRGGDRFELGVDTDSVLFHMPIDHDALAAIAQVPLGEQIVVPGAKLLGVRRAGRRGLSPYVFLAHAKDGIGHVRNGGTQLVFLNEAPAHVEEVLVGFPMLAGAHPFESRISPHGVEGEQQSLAQHLAIQDFTSGGTFEVLREIKAQICLFQDVEQTRHRPPPTNLSLEPAQVPGLFLWLQWGQGNPAAAFVQNADLLLRERAVEGRQGLAHLGL